MRHAGHLVFGQAPIVRYTLVSRSLLLDSLKSLLPKPPLEADATPLE